MNNNNYEIRMAFIPFNVKIYFKYLNKSLRIKNKNINFL